MANGTAKGMIDENFYDHTPENMTLCAALEPRWPAPMGIAVSKNNTALNDLL